MGVTLEAIMDADFILDAALRNLLSENFEGESLSFLRVLTVERAGLVNRGLCTFTVALDNLVFGGLLRLGEHQS